MATTKILTASLVSAELITRVSKKTQNEYTVLEITWSLGGDQEYKQSLFPTNEQNALLALASNAANKNNVNVKTQ